MTPGPRSPRRSASGQPNESGQFEIYVLPERGDGKVASFDERRHEAPLGEERTGTLLRVYRRADDCTADDGLCVCGRHPQQITRWPVLLWSARSHVRRVARRPAISDDQGERQRGGRQIAQFQSDSSGQFTVHLDPGVYTVVPNADAPVFSPMVQAKPVTVEDTGVLTVVRLTFDTGIR